MTTENTAGALMAQYLSDNAWVHARERLALLEQNADPGTIRHLEALGVGQGWRCLEVGAGGGSIAEWLCRRVGPTGRVVATDIDTRFLDALDYPNLEVRRHDIVADELEQDAFDLVHTRATLFHLAARETVLDRMVSALKPGGCLLAEETDAVTMMADPRVGADRAAVFTKVFSVGPWMLAAAGGSDHYYGRRLYGDVCARRLLDVGAEGRTTMGRGGTPLARFHKLTIEQNRDRFIASGRFSADDMDEFITLLNDPDFIWMDLTRMAVWGRRPPV